MLKLLRDALSQRAQNIRIAKNLEEGTLPEDFQETAELRVNKWWLDEFFSRHRLSFTQGIFLIYGILEVPKLLILLFVMGRSEGYFVNAFASTMLGDLVFPMALVLAYNVHKSLSSVATWTNENLKNNRIVATPTFIRKNYALSETPRQPAELDKEYSNRYIKPVMLKTVQLGYDLSFDKKYQVGSGIIGSSLVLLIMYLRFVSSVLPPSAVFVVAEPGIPEIAGIYKVDVLFMMSVAWGMVGMMAWTLFTAFLLNIQVAGNPLGVRPYESIKESFSPVTDLMLATSFAVTLMVAWYSPFALVWSVLPSDALIRQAASTFVASILVIMVPVIILSFAIPTLKIHKGMAKSRERLALLKAHQLEELKKKRGRLNLNRYLMIQRHLIQDYKDIQSNSTWLLNVRQLLQVIGSILLPIVTFIISVRV